MQPRKHFMSCLYTRLFDVLYFYVNVLIQVQHSFELSLSPFLEANHLRFKKSLKSALGKRNL